MFASAHHHKDLWIVAAFLFIASSPVAQAQNTCNTNATPCLDQPSAGQKTITGQWTQPAAPPAAGIMVRLEIDGNSAGIPPVPVNPDGTFAFIGYPALKASSTVEVIQSVPPPTAGITQPTTGRIVVLPGTDAGRVCGKAQPPCLDQPLEGQVQVTGSLTSGADPAPNTVVRIKINDTDQGITGQIEKGKFTFTSLKALSQYDTIEVIQTAPAPVGGANPTTTGKVKVQANTASTKLNLSFSPSTFPLAFGHQAMQTASAAQKVTITNSMTSDVEMEDISMTLTSTNYSISSNSCIATIAKTKTCSFSITFTPFSSGTHPGSVENDFAVIVPKTLEAEQRSRELLRELDSSRKKEAYLEGLSQTALQHETKEQREYRVSWSLLGGAITGSGTATSTAQAKDNYDRQVRNTKAIVEDLEREFQVIPLSGIPDHWDYPLTRAVVGIDLSAPSAQSVKQAYFVDFDLLAPFKIPWLPKNEDPLENRIWLWFNPRITSLPQAANFSALSTINQTGSFLTQETSKGTLGDIQGLDVNGGFEIAIVKPRDGIPWWAGYANTEARLAPSLLVGFGMSTPFSTDNTDVISQANQGICGAFSLINPNLPTPKVAPTVSTSAGLVCGNSGSMGNPPNATFIVAPSMSGTGTQNDNYIDFFTPERSRFFRKAYGGIRLKTYFFSRTIKGNCNPPVTRGETQGDCDGLYNIFPGTIDLTTGKDEAVTAGHMTTWLFRVEANYPLPFYPGVHIFASLYTVLKGNNLTQPYNSYTINTPTSGSNNDANTFRFGIQPLNRDYYRVGIGVDLIQLFKKSSSGGQPSSQAPAANSTTPTTTNP